MRYENLAVRKAMRKHGVRFHELAKHLGIGQPTLSTKLSKERSFEWQTKMILAVVETAQEKEDKRSMATKNKILTSILPALERAVENLPNKVDIIGIHYAHLGGTSAPQLEIQVFLGIDNVAPNLKRHRLQKEAFDCDGCDYPYKYFYTDHGVTVFQLSNEDGELDPWPEAEDDEPEEEEEDEYYD